MHGQGDGEQLEQERSRGVAPEPKEEGEGGAGIVRCQSGQAGALRTGTSGITARARLCQIIAPGGQRWGGRRV